MHPRIRFAAIPIAFGLMSFMGARPGSAHPGAGIAVDGEGNVYFSHTGGSNWKVGLDGKLVRQEGPGWHFLALDPKGSFLSQRWPRFHEEIRPGVVGDADSEVKAVGKSPTLLCASSFPMALGPDSALYYPDIAKDEIVHIMRLAPGGEPTDYAKLPLDMEIGFEGKPEKALWIHGLAAGRDGSLYYCEKESVRRIDTKGKVTQVAEKIELPGYKYPEGHRGGPILRGLDVAADGTLYAAAFGAHSVIRITQAGKVEVVLRSEDLWAPTGIAVRGNDVYVLEFFMKEVTRREDWLPRVRKLSQDGSVAVVATIPQPQ